jgi:hypothetical protein
MVLQVKISIFSIVYGMLRPIDWQVLRSQWRNLHVGLLGCSVQFIRPPEPVDENTPQLNGFSVAIEGAPDVFSVLSVIWPDAPARAPQTSARSGSPRRRSFAYSDCGPTCSWKMSFDCWLNPSASLAATSIIRGVMIVDQSVHGRCLSIAGRIHEIKIKLFKSEWTWVPGLSINIK